MEILFVNKIFFSLTGDIKNYKINIDIKSNQFKDKIIEVEISLSLKPSESSFEKINTKIVYSAIVEIEGDLLNKDKLKQVILVKVPNDIYDDMRKIFIFIHLV